MASLRALSLVASLNAKEILFRFGLWAPDLPRDLMESVSKLVKANEPYWPKMEYGDIRILVEGHLSQYGPNYAFRTAVAARALKEKLHFGIEVVFNGYSHQWLAAKEVYQSFGIDKAIYLGTAMFPLNIGFYCFSRLIAIWYRAKLKSPEDILKITLNGIKVGDLIYDDIIREGPNKTVDTLDRRVTAAIARNLNYYFKYQRLFKRRVYAYYIATHTAYSEYGMLCRVALMNGVKVIETTDIQMSFYDRISSEILPTYHEGIRNSIVTDLRNGASKRDARLVRARAALKERLDANVSQVDVQNAYSGTIFSKAALKDELGIRNSHKIVFVMAHVFSDAPHLSSAMLHPDYYRWLSSTLDIAQRSSALNWIVKPHPSCAIYGEEGVVEGMVRNLASDKIYLCPPALNTKSIEACADALVTVHGTAGLEFSCLGIPVVLAGRPFYSGFGFTLEPDSIAQYDQALINLRNVSPLSEKGENRALEVYAIWEALFDWNNPIVTSDVVANVWGNGRPRNLEQSYTMIADNLRAANPRKLKLWEFAQTVAE